MKEPVKIDNDKLQERQCEPTPFIEMFSLLGQQGIKVIEVVQEVRGFQKETRFFKNGTDMNYLTTYNNNYLLSTCYAGDEIEAREALKQKNASLRNTDLGMTTKKNN